jgi:hypothetical protein
MRYFYVESVLFPWEPEDSRGTSLTNLDEFAYEFNPDYASDDYAEACELGKTIINSISNPYMNSVFSSNLDNTKHFIVKMMQIFHFDMDVVMWRMFGISFYTSGWNKNLLKDADLPKHMFVTLDELYGKILKRLENESHAKTRAESVMSMFKNIKEIFGERPDYLRNMNAEQFKVLVDTLYSLISTIPENFDVTYDDDRFDKILRGLVKIRGPKNVLSYLEFVFKDLTSIVQRFGSAGKTSMIYTYYQDYISMVAQLDGTENRMSHPEYKFKTAEEIIRAHDNVLVVYNLTKNEKDYKDKQEKFEKIWTDEKKERYQYSDTTFSVLVPKDVLEIAMEGDTLHHCVKSYINKVIEDQTNILFVRKTAELTKPFFTLEIRCEEVRQCHGFGNSNVETEAGLEEFLQDYCKAKQFKYLDPDRVLAAG